VRANSRARLAERGHSVLALHGDLEQREREEMLLRFANGSCAVLVATDVAARGLDIKDLPMVINYDIAHDADTTCTASAAPAARAARDSPGRCAAA
jgi:superfamily II DNA/RNA helicase